MTIFRVSQSYKLNADIKEQAAIINSIKYIIHDLNEELSTRTGFSSHEYEHLIRLLSEDLNIQAFNKTELIMIHQALNEVCNGIYIPNFESEIGISLSDAKSFFEPLEKLTS